MMRWLILLPIITFGCKSSRDKAPSAENHVAPAIPEQNFEMNEVDRYGDPLPDKAIARLGSIRMVDRALEAMVFAPDGTFLISNRPEGYALWTISSATSDRVLRSDDPSNVFAISPSSKQLAARRSTKGIIELLNIEKDGVSQTLKGHSKEVTDLCYGDNTQLFSGDVGGQLRVWDLSSGVSTPIDYSNAPITTLHCKSKDEVLFGTQNGHVVYLKNGKTTLLGEGTSRVNAIAADAQGNIAAADGDGYIRLWAPGKTEPNRIEAHSRTTLDVSFRSDGKLISSGGDWWFRVWDSKNGEMIEERPGIQGLDAQLFTLSSDGGLMASWSFHAGERGSEAGRFWLWNPNEGSMLLEPERHSLEITSIAFSPDGKSIATGSIDRFVRTWDVSTGKALDLLDTAQSAVHDVTYTKDGKNILSAGKDAYVSSWSLSPKGEKHLIEYVGGPVNALEFSPTSKRIYTGDQTGRVWSWDIASGQKIQAYDKGGFSSIRALAMSLDEKFLAMAGSDRHVRVANLQTGAEVAKLDPGDTATNYALAFSTDGRILATGGEDMKIHLWNTKSWKKIQSLPGHDGTVRALAFSKDGRFIASGGHDEMVRVWNVAESKQVAQFEGHQDVVTAIAWSPTGSILASASRDHTALLWAME